MPLRGKEEQVLLSCNISAPVFDSYFHLNFEYHFKTNQSTNMKTLFILTCLSFAGLFIDLEKRSLIDGKIEILVPKEFTEMDMKEVLIKYPGKNRPKLILTDESGTVNLGFSHADSPADSTMIKDYKDVMINSYKQRAPGTVFVGEGVTSIHGKKVGYFKMITQAIDQQIFNHIFLTDCEGKLLVGTFNCLQKDKAVWEPVAEQIVQSLRVK